jgi:hypothetical protein
VSRRVHDQDAEVRPGRAGCGTAFAASSFQFPTMAQPIPPGAVPQTPIHSAANSAVPAAGRPSPSILRGAEQLLAIIEEEKARSTAQLQATHEADKLWWSQTIAHLQQQGQQTAAQLEAQRDQALTRAAESERLAQENYTALEQERNRADAEAARANAAEAQLAAAGYGPWPMSSS